MEDYPRTLEEFEGRFVTEQACREYLMQPKLAAAFCVPPLWGINELGPVVGGACCAVDNAIIRLR